MAGTQNFGFGQQNSGFGPQGNQNQGPGTPSDPKKYTTIVYDMPKTTKHEITNVPFSNIDEDLVFGTKKN